MTLWTFKHKITGDIIRFNLIETGDPEFGDRYYFSECEALPPWFTDNKKDIDDLLNKKSSHPFYSQMCGTPSLSDIKLEDYEIKEIMI